MLSFRRVQRFARNSAETIRFYKISTPENQVKLRYFTQRISWKGKFLLETFSRGNYCTHCELFRSCTLNRIQKKIFTFLFQFLRKDFWQTYNKRNFKLNSMSEKRNQFCEILHCGFPIKDNKSLTIFVYLTSTLLIKSFWVIFP